MSTLEVTEAFLDQGSSREGVTDDIDYEVKAEGTYREYEATGDPFQLLFGNENGHSGDKSGSDKARRVGNKNAQQTWSDKQCKALDERFGYFKRKHLGDIAIDPNEADAGQRMAQYIETTIVPHREAIIERKKKGELPPHNTVFGSPDKFKKRMVEKISAKLLKDPNWTGQLFCTIKEVEGMHCVMKEDRKQVDKLWFGMLSVRVEIIMKKGCVTNIHLPLRRQKGQKLSGRSVRWARGTSRRYEFLDNMTAGVDENKVNRDSKSQPQQNSDAAPPSSSPLTASSGPTSSESAPPRIVEGIDGHEVDTGPKSQSAPSSDDAPPRSTPFTDSSAPPSSEPNRSTERKDAACHASQEKCVL